jgi:hypothetical protein
MTLALIYIPGCGLRGKTIRYYSLLSLPSFAYAAVESLDCDTDGCISNGGLSLIRELGKQVQAHQEDQLLAVVYLYNYGYVMYNSQNRIYVKRVENK